MDKAGNKQKTHLVSNKDKIELRPPGPVFLSLLPESAGGVKAAQAEVSKINILSGSKVARLTRQPSIFISGTYLFILLFGQSGHGEVT